MSQRRLPPAPALVAVKSAALRTNSRRRRYTGSGVTSEAGGGVPSFVMCRWRSRCGPCAAATIRRLLDERIVAAALEQHKLGAVALGHQLAAAGAGGGAPDGRGEEILHALEV